MRERARDFELLQIVDVSEAVSQGLVFYFCFCTFFEAPGDVYKEEAGSELVEP